MRTPANVARHPIHPMLVPIPIGLWVFSFICDLVFLGGGRETWHTVAFYAMACGIIGAVIAALPGLIDMLSLRGELRRTALVHMSLNLAVIALYLANLWSRTTVPEATPVWLSAFSIVLLLVSGWLGGKMVYVHGVAVEPAPQPGKTRRREAHA